MADLSGRVALVTGGSRGLGRSMVMGLAEAGADVIVVSRKLDACEQVAAEVEAATGRTALPLACHVGYWDQIDSLVETVYARFPRIDVLVNNAGLSPLYPDVASITEALYDKVFDINLKGPFRLAQRIGQRMVDDGGGGSIINISTVGSLRPTGSIIPYAAAKAGLNAMTVAFAHAFGPTVRVNCVVPGAFLTHAVDSWDEATRRAAAANPMLKRIGDPDEIVGAVLYFASDASSYTTGALLRVDGGAPA
jgi:NAD(P)-dependent dehydrogenase (short-subunit alcohol dehydrogenase family)